MRVYIGIDIGGCHCHWGLSVGFTSRGCHLGVTIGYCDLILYFGIIIWELTWEIQLDIAFWY